MPYVRVVRELVGSEWVNYGLQVRILCAAIMGRCDKLVKSADCKSVTHVVNIVGSNPTRPTIVPA